MNKNESLALKGIAILIMIFHHCFCEASRYDGYTINFFPFPEAAVNDVTLYFKICVSIFAFITGYGLCLSFNTSCESVSKWTLKRLIKTFSGFWFVYILSLIVTMAVRHPIKTYEASNILMSIAYGAVDFLGLANLFGTPTMNATWWYMSAAAFFIICIPLIVLSARHIGYIPICAALVFLPRILGIGYLGGTNGFSFLLIVVLGAMFAERELFQSFEAFLDKHNPAVNFTLASVILIASIYAWIKLGRSLFWEYHFAIAPLIFILYSKYYILRFTPINKCLQFLGKHSLNVFLTHTFIRAYFFSQWTYSFESMWLIPIILLLESLIISLTIEGLKGLVRYDSMVKAIIEKACAAIDKSR